MRLNKCPKVENYLINNNFVDERHIWCYAQMKANLATQENTTPLYGLVLVCIKNDVLYIYVTKFNSTMLDLFYVCHITKMQRICLDKKLLSMKFSFTCDLDSFHLEMDDWKRFSCVFDHL